MNLPARITVTAAEFTRQFGQLRHGLGDSPVHVTHHGRETHVLLSAARFDELRRMSTGMADRRPLPDLAVFAEWIEHAVFVLDAAGTVVFANAAAHALARAEIGALAGLPLWSAVPALAGTLVEVQARNALATGERSVAELPSPIGSGRWLRIAIEPAALATTVLIRDITAEVTRERLGDEPSAIAAAAGRHHRVAIVRLNPRGHIVRADAAFCELVKLDAERLAGVAFADLVPTARKAALRTTLDIVLGGGEVADIATELLTNDGRAVAVSGVLAGARGIYGLDGAVLLITPD